MQRYNIFHLIHKGLRAALYDTAWKLQQADLSQVETAEAMLDPVREAVLLIDQHNRKIKSTILPLIDPFEPAVACCLGEEHSEVTSLGKSLTLLADSLQYLGSEMEKQNTLRQITDVFIEYMVLNLRRMNREEKVLHQVLGRYYSAEEIRHTVAHVIQSTPPWMQDFYAKWMLRGMNDQETIAWMKAIRRGMPVIVYQTIFTKAAQELPAGRFSRISSELKAAIVA